MASLIRNCLDRLVKAGKISPATAEAAERLHEGIQPEFIGPLGPSRADAAAALEAARAIAKAARQKKLGAAMTAIADARLQARMTAHPNGESAGLVSALSLDPWGHSKGVNVESLTEEVTGAFLDRAGAAMRPYESTLAGLKQDTQGVRNMVREIYGDVDTKDGTAKAAAGGWKAAVDYGVDRHAKTGASLSVLEDWRLPQTWDRTRIAPGKPGSQRAIAGRRAFKTEMLREADAGNITIMDKETGMPALPVVRDVIIERMMDDVARGGMSGTGGKGFNRDMRVVRINNSDAWLRLMDKYGAGSGGIFDMLQGHIRGMSREIALKEIGGPDYEAVFGAALERAQVAKKVTGRAGGAVARTLTGPRVAELAYMDLTGQLSAPESDALAGFFGGVRNLKTASSLGSAFISAVPGDTVTTFLASRQMGIPATKVIKRALQIMVRDTDGGRAAAGRLNIISHATMDAVLAAKRFEDQIVGNNFLGRLASTVIRASWLQRWTEGMKRAFSMEANAMIADQVRFGWNRIDPAFKRFLESHGFTAADWAEIRKTPLLDIEGGTFYDVAAAGDLGKRLSSAIIDERHFAVIEPTAVTRAITTMGTKRGTVPGELLRSSFMFKSFSVTIMLTHLMRALSEGPWEQRAFRFAGYMGAMAIAGGMAIQAKQLIAGKDPRDMTTMDFWLGAFAQGGGLGIYGDFVYSAYSRSGQGLLGTLAGPVISTPGQVTDLINKLWGPTTGKSKGEAIAGFVKQWLPGSTLWQTRLAADRWVFDFLQRLGDPQAAQSFTRQRRDLMANYDQGFWWGPGSGLPERAPSLGAVAGAAP